MVQNCRLIITMCTLFAVIGMSKQAKANCGTLQSFDHIIQCHSEGANNYVDFDELDFALEELRSAESKLETPSGPLSRETLLLLLKTAATVYDAAEDGSLAELNYTRLLTIEANIELLSSPYSEGLDKIQAQKVLGPSSTIHLQTSDKSVYIDGESTEGKDTLQLISGPHYLAFEDEGTHWKGIWIQVPSPSDASPDHKLQLKIVDAQPVFQSIEALAVNTKPTGIKELPPTSPKALLMTQPQKIALAGAGLQLGLATTFGLRAQKIKVNYFDANCDVWYIGDCDQRSQSFIVSNRAAITFASTGALTLAAALVGPLLFSAQEDDPFEYGVGDRRFRGPKAYDFKLRVVPGGLLASARF